jgi:tRNA modification GTPase
MLFNPADTICAISTPSGVGALGVIRVSGEKAIPITDKIFSKYLAKAKGYSLHFGSIKNDDGLIDQVMLSVFRGPRSFTGEDTVEISCHGSEYIKAAIVQELLTKGCRMAQPGEYSMRAFGNGKMDLSQSEAVADLIASSSKAAHKLAMNQMRGSFSKEINHYYL